MPNTAAIPKSHIAVSHCCAYMYVSYLEGESVLAGAQPHVLHGGAVDHHLSHISAGHKNWAAGSEEEKLCDYDDIIMITF